MEIRSIGQAEYEAAILGLVLLRRFLLRARMVRTSETWDCGYAAPGPRMQYSGFSFVQTTAGLFRRLIPAQRRVIPPSGLFPRQGSFAIKTHDGFLLTVYEPLFRGVGWALGRLRWVQHGMSICMSSILITTLALLSGDCDDEHHCIAHIIHSACGFAAGSGND